MVSMLYMEARRSKDEEEEKARTEDVFRDGVM